MRDESHIDIFAEFSGPSGLESKGELNSSSTSTAHNNTGYDSSLLELILLALNFPKKVINWSSSQGVFPDPGHIHGSFGLGAHVQRKDIILKLCIILKNELVLARLDLLHAFLNEVGVAPPGKWLKHHHDILILVESCTEF